MTRLTRRRAIAVFVASGVMPVGTSQAQVDVVAAALLSVANYFQRARDAILSLHHDAAQFNPATISASQRRGAESDVRALVQHLNFIYATQRPIFSVIDDYIAAKQAGTMSEQNLARTWQSLLATLNSVSNGVQEALGFLDEARYLQLVYSQESRDHLDSLLHSRAMVIRRLTDQPQPSTPAQLDALTQLNQRYKSLHAALSDVISELRTLANRLHAA